MSSYDPDSLPAEDGEVNRLAHRARLGRRGFIRRMKELGLAKGMRVLDLGCGEGTLTTRLASYVHPAPVVGFDRSERLLTRAREFAAKLDYPALRFVSGEAESLPFPEDSFDFVYVRLVLQHLPDPALVLRGIYRVLAPGGILVVEDIDHEMVFVHPVPPSWEPLRARWCEGQRRCGGDPTIGRKLAGLLRESPFGGGVVKLQPAHGHGPAITEYARELGPSLLDYLTDPEDRRAGEAMFDQLAHPETARQTDLYLIQFIARAVKPGKD